MKTILLGLVALVICAAFGVGYMNALNAERAEFADAAARVGTPFVIPATRDDPGPVLDALTSAARSTRSNIYRTVIGATPQGASTVTQYVFLAGESSRVVDTLEVSAGRLPTADETRAGTASAGTAPSTRPERTVGELRTLWPGEERALRPLARVFDSLPAPGTYLAECPRRDCAAFTDALATALSGDPTKAPVTAADLRAARVVTLVPTATQPVYPGMLLAAGTVLVAILALYRQFREAKHAGVLRMQGIGATRAWWIISGRPIAGTALITLVLGTGIAVTLPGMHPAVLGSLAQTVGITGVLLLAVTAPTIPYLARLRIAEFIKNRRDTRAIFGLSLIASATTAVAVIVVGSGLWAGADGLNAEVKKLEIWAASTEYGVFAPLRNGDETLDIQSGSLTLIARTAGQLYPRLAARGALYVDATSYDEGLDKNSVDPDVFPALKVNPAYLARYPLRDTNGQRIRVDESERDWIILAPESYRDREEQLLATTRRNRAGAAQSSQKVLGVAAPPGVQDQSVRIIWTKNGQDVFAFSPTVGTKNAGRIRDPLIEVMTRENSTAWDAANAITGGPDGALRVPLIGGDGRKTRSSLAPILAEYGLDDNLPSLVTIGEAEQARLAYARDAQVKSGMLGGALILLLLLMTAQSLTIALERFARPIAVRGLHGHGPVHRYRELLRIGIILGFVYLAAGSGLWVLDLHPFSPAIPPLGQSLTVAAGICVLQGVAAVIIVTKRKGIRP
ncbi:hypothetical protein D9V34_02135 [Mycetocola lacteus]|uniref:ABC transporter permease n=1 Tax=Mycetocola lacteus TaxID=76637 RepID=A0A3L7AWB0_9MICO|nr:hypothetical protein [Mycetocola lacteus]RLP84819.1 hypothetical protein D9V34_02135 [Mycetocola lacteus]